MFHWFLWRTMAEVGLVARRLAQVRLMCNRDWIGCCGWGWISYYGGLRLVTMEGCGWGWIGYYGGLWLRLDRWLWRAVAEVWLLQRAVAEVGMVTMDGCGWGWIGYYGYLRSDWLLWRSVAEIGLVTMESCGCGWGWDWLLWRIDVG